jgi:small GTP-binding protein
MVNRKPVLVNLFDTAGQSDYDSLRSHCYHETDIALICFNVMSRPSWENVKAKWLPELYHSIPEVPKLLVGCQCDLGNINPLPQQALPVTQTEIDKLCKRLGIKYFKTSAMADIGIKECFDTAINLCLNYQIKKGNPPKQPELKSTKITIENSTFPDDWQKVLQCTRYSDVIFIVEETEQLQAHKIVLCSASKIFA